MSFLQFQWYFKLRACNKFYSFCMKGYSVSLTNLRAMSITQSNERNFLTTLLNVTEYTATSGATFVQLKGRLHLFSYKSR